MKKILAFLVVAYALCFLWPGRWRYDHLGAMPVRTERVTGRVQFMNLHGWNWQLPPIGGDYESTPYPVKPTVTPPPTPQPIPKPTPAHRFRGLSHPWRPLGACQKVWSRDQEIYG